ncbi:MAG: SDR family oxidoreductase [bacterium]|nr:SDR family oxidoreductase [bacterium]
MKIKGKKILITGGSMGIGAKIAEACAMEGASVIITARHKNDLEKTLASLPRPDDANHTFFILDVSKKDEVKNLAEKIQKEHSYIDGLVNCAGIYGPIGKTDEVDLEKLEETLRVNLLGTFFMCHYFIPVLKKSKRGKIINLSGGGGTGPFPNYSAYATSKVGVVRLTENMGLEYKNQNIDINAIAPGFVVTRLHAETLQAGEKAGHDFLETTKKGIEKGGVPGERAAGLAVFLLSDESNGVTGKCISAPWEPWETFEFKEKLKNDKDFCTLRRIDGQNFSKSV